MKVIAITGGIGSGKSTVRRLFEEEGARGIDADDLARRAVAPGTEGARLVREAFGSGFFNGEGRLDRQRMAALVFDSREARRRLEEILHPIIRRLERAELEKIGREKPDAVVAVEVPLLVEGKRAADYDMVVNVVAPESTRIARLAASGRYTEAEARSRIASQTDDRSRSEKAHATINNDGLLEETRRQVRTLLSRL